MPLSDGTRLGPYEILGPLGAGGMGEVYRARDTRLDRPVAVKVIPAHLAAETEVRQRFEREARAVSAINHPHICVLHDIGHEGSTHFFVMEYLDGDTLAARVDKGAMAPEEFLPIAIQIADALAAAHRAGIVHRDLKPGNIVLTRGGAKLLDFGLARATGLAATPGSGLTQSPTLARPLTAEGTIVGTFQYMAPEQLEGKDADARTDIFAFGAVLYEMATGRRAFDGTSQASLIANILKDTPRPMSEIAPLTPPALEPVVRRCLAKRPDDRWQSAADVMHQLEWIRDAGSQAGVPAPVASQRRRTARVAWGMAAAAVIAALALGVRVATNRPPAPMPVRFVLLPPEGTTFDQSQTSVIAAPDGSGLAFIAFDSTGASRIWLRRFAALASTPVPNTKNAIQPFWSPDSRSIAFFSDEKLRRVSLTDGTVQALADAPQSRGGTWGANDDIVFQPDASGPLFHVRATGGEIHAVTVVDTMRGEDAHRFPCFLPDGRHFLFVVLPATNNVFNVRVGSLDGATTAPILTSPVAVAYSEPYLVFAREQLLVAQRFDAGSFKLSGDPLPLGEPPGTYGGWTGAPGAAVSNNGVLVHASDEYPRTEGIWFDRSGRRLGRLPLAQATWIDGAFSADGSRYVLTAWDPSGDANLWLMDLNRSLATRFTFAKGENFDPLWSPDGKNVVFVSSREGRENLYIKPANSASEEKRLFDSGKLFTKTESWSPDGKWIVFSTLSSETGADLWLYSMAEDLPPKPLIATRFNEVDATVSPDGKWLLYRSDETGRQEMYARSFPEMGEKYRLSDDVLGASTTTNFFWSAWRDDGREVVFPGADGRSVVSVGITLAGGFRASVPRVLFRVPANNYYTSMLPNGEKFLVVIPEQGEQATLHTVVLNWPALLERR